MLYFVQDYCFLFMFCLDDLERSNNPFVLSACHQRQYCKLCYCLQTWDQNKSWYIEIVISCCPLLAIKILIPSYHSSTYRAYSLASRFSIIISNQSNLSSCASCGNNDVSAATPPLFFFFFFLTRSIICQKLSSTSPVLSDTPEIAKLWHKSSHSLWYTVYSPSHNN